MPVWMKGNDSSLENLQMDLLEEPADNSEEDDLGMVSENEILEENDEDGASEEGSRMIDMPYLFDD